MTAKWIGGVVAVVAVFALAGQCGGDAAPGTVSGAPAAVPTTTPLAAPTTHPAPIQPAHAAPVVTSAPRTAPATTRPAPTRPTTPTTTPAPRPAPRPAVAAAVDDDDDDDDRSGSSAYYKNCKAARNAGAAPVHRGEPGYGSHLDRDGDGTGCE